MSMLELPIKLIVDKTLQSILQGGQEVRVPVRQEIQNDAETLDVILSVVDVAEDQYKDKYALIRRLRHRLRPMVKQGQAMSVEGEHELGKLQLSEEALEFLIKLKDEPPEVQGQGGKTKMSYRGAMLETLCDLQDFADELKRSKEPAEPEGAEDDKEISE
jgi:hypothetical protein